MQQEAVRTEAFEGQRLRSSAGSQSSTGGWKSVRPKTLALEEDMKQLDRLGAEMKRSVSEMGDWKSKGGSNTLIDDCRT